MPGGSDHPRHRRGSRALDRAQPRHAANGRRSRERHAAGRCRVHHWTDRLFSFRTTRNPAFRFRNGQFTMLGLQVEGRPLLRAYSMASANHDEHLEFFSIKVPDGPLTSRLQHSRDMWERGMVLEPAAGSTLSARDRHRARAVHQHRQGPRDIRPVRQGRASPRLPGRRARLWRGPHQ